MKQTLQFDFEQHWTVNVTPVSEAKLQEAADFLQPLATFINDANTPHILDVGCGDGIHSMILSQLDCHYTGVDISTNAVSTAKARMATNVDAAFAIGDALILPFADNAFDAVFSYGVIAYTGAPSQAVAEMMRVCKPGGLVGVWVYPKPKGIPYALLTLTRLLARLAGRKFTRLFIVYPLVVLLPVLPVQSGVSLLNSSWKQCVEVIEVNILPTKLQFPTKVQVTSWFAMSNLTITFDASHRPISLWGRK